MTSRQRFSVGFLKPGKKFKMLLGVTAIQMKQLCPGGISNVRNKEGLTFLPAGAGVDRREGEEHQGTAVHHAHGAVGRGDQVEACEYGRPGDSRAGEEGVQAGCARRSPRQGKAGLLPPRRKPSALVIKCCMGLLDLVLQTDL